MCLRVSYKRKIFFWSLKSLEESDPEFDPDPLVRGTDPQIRIRTKMSRIPNTASWVPTCFESSGSTRVVHTQGPRGQVHEPDGLREEEQGAAPARRQCHLSPRY